jgi:hypothetical protein
MRRGQLSDHLVGAAVKRLSAVDADPVRSNQHEVGTTRQMRASFLGEDRQRRFEVTYIRLGEEDDALTLRGTATHYDARAATPSRSPEWRLYYHSNAVTEAMREGDTLFLAKDTVGMLYFIVTPEGSTAERQLFWLFGLPPPGRSFVARELSGNDFELDFAARFILDEIGIDPEAPDTDELDSIIDRYGAVFPQTAEFSRLARETAPEIAPRDDPDAALMAWLEQEEALFRRLERRVLSARLEAGFVAEGRVDVDGFLRFSLSVQNRRKSRMGHSLENHLGEVFRACGVRHVRGAVTERRNRPDFLFPDVETYHAARPGDDRLLMLGAKSTCKDRWRQVLSEAAKIPRKHLLTLEPGISEAQTDEMRAANLHLVVPRSVQRSYGREQRDWLATLSDFVERARGERSGP